MIWLFRWLKGYLNIEIFGNQSEQILNFAAKNRIILWNLKYKRGKIYGNVSIDGFYRLRSFRRKLKIKIKILKKCGLPFKTVRLKKRWGLMAGIIVFFALLKILSGCIWNIEIVGNEKISRNEILNSCKKCGIYEGRIKSEINPAISSQKLLLSIKKLAWASVNIEGCKVTINVTEIRDIGKDTSKPTNIKAAFDGTIKKMDITSGIPIVKVGDVVKRGDLLVSGVTDGSGREAFIHSSGSITATTRREVTSFANYKQKVYIKNEKVENKYALNFFSFNLPLYLGDISTPYKCEIERKKFMLFGVDMPIEITKKKIIYLKEKNICLTKEELVKQLEQENAKKIAKLNIDSYKIIDTEINILSDGIKMKTIIETTEDVALQEIIIVN